MKTISKQEFINEYWQKKPALIKSGFNDFVDPISPDELAGLAMEECIESRLISNHNNEWQAHHGPFEDFELLTPKIVPCWCKLLTTGTLRLPV